MKNEDNVLLDMRLLTEEGIFDNKNDFVTQNYNGLSLKENHFSFGGKSEKLVGGSDLTCNSNNSHKVKSEK